MALTADTRLGSYEVTAQIGVGGMGGSTAPAIRGLDATSPSSYSPLF